MKRVAVIFLGLLLSGCAHQRFTVTSNFRSARIERELNYYVANFSTHETNHFYVVGTKLDHGLLIEGEVYWKEERTILRYAELEPDSWADMEAWPNDQLKLDRDTVDTQEEADTSSYMETHRTWVEWMERCITRGKPYFVLKSEALRVAPSGNPPHEESTTSPAIPSKSTPHTNGNWQYHGPPISVIDIMTKSSDIAAARYGHSNKNTNGAVPANVNIQKDSHPSPE